MQEAGALAATLSGAVLSIGPKFTELPATPVVEVILTSAAKIVIADRRKRTYLIG
jgi:hypothetical protein